MEREKTCFSVDPEESIREGTLVSLVYKQIYDDVQQGIDIFTATDKKGNGGMNRESENSINTRKIQEMKNRLCKQKYAPEAIFVSVITNDVKKIIKINDSAFENVTDFTLKLNKFLKDMICVSAKLKVKLGGMSKKLFATFVLDSFNLFGNIETLMNSFKPVRLSALQRSGLTGEGVFRSIFLFQDFRDSMRAFLTFNIFTVSIYCNNRYIGEFLDSVYRRTISRILGRGKYGGIQDVIEPASNGSSMMDGCGKIVPLLSGMYLLFDIFNFDEMALQNVFYIILLLVNDKRNANLVEFLGLNDIFICTARLVCEGCVPSHVLMMACKDKLNMKYKVDSVGVSMDYVYSCLYKPYLAVVMPECFAHLKVQRRSVVPLGKPIEMAPNKIKVELTKNGSGSSIGEPAYSPLSRRLSGGLRRGDLGFKSKQKLTFD